MTIKEIEKLTGLTAKSIRYYEDKGLISVDRKSGNNYRDYTEDNLKELKRMLYWRMLPHNRLTIIPIYTMQLTNCPKNYA